LTSNYQNEKTQIRLRNLERSQINISHISITQPDPKIPTPASSWTQSNNLESSLDGRHSCIRDGSEIHLWGIVWHRRRLHKSSSTRHIHLLYLSSSTTPGSRSVGISQTLCKAETDQTERYSNKCGILENLSGWNGCVGFGSDPGRYCM
jgi:hypothetical protein